MQISTQKSNFIVKITNNLRVLFVFRWNIDFYLVLKFELIEGGFLL